MSADFISGVSRLRIWRSWRRSLCWIFEGAGSKQMEFVGMGYDCTMG